MVYRLWYKGELIPSKKLTHPLSSNQLTIGYTSIQINSPIILYTLLKWYILTGLRRINNFGRNKVTATFPSCLTLLLLLLFISTPCPRDRLVYFLFVSVRARFEHKSSIITQNHTSSQAIFAVHLWQRPYLLTV